MKPLLAICPDYLATMTTPVAYVANGGSPRDPCFFMNPGVVSS